MRLIEPTLIRVLPEDILLAQGADPQSLRERRPSLWQRVCEAIAIGRQLIRPIVWEKGFAVISVRHHKILLDDSHTLSGKLVVDHLAGADRVVIGIATLGAGIDEEIQQWMKRDISFGFLLDTFGSVAAEKLTTYAQECIISEACANGENASMPLSPGLIGWPIDQGQPQIFGALNPDPSCIHLTPMAQIVPRKSCSYVIGIGKGLVQGTPCDYCAVRETCMQRNKGNNRNA